MAALIDTNILLAAVFVRDQNYPIARAALRSLKGAENRIVPTPVLQELFYMATVRISYERAIVAIESIQNGAFDIQPLIADDRRRMIQIMRQYASAEFDYPDVAIMALAERLDIRQIYTFDHRDFRIFRPTHCEYLELLP